MSSTPPPSSGSRAPDDPSPGPSKAGMQAALLDPRSTPVKVGHADVEFALSSANPKLPESTSDQLTRARESLVRLEREVAALRNKSQRVDALLYAAPVAVLELDAQGVVTFANPAALEALGILDPRALIGRLWVECIAAEQRASAMQLLRRAVSGLAAVIEVDTVDSYEPRSLAISLIPMGEGRVLCVAQDITARLRSERRQRELLQQMQLAQKVGRIGSWRWDRRTDEVSISAEAQRLLRIRPSLTRVSLEDLFLAILPDNPATAFAWAADTRAHGNVQPRTVSLVTSTGSRILQLRGDVVTDDVGRVQGHVGTVQDISEQRAAESERRELLEQMLHVQKLESLGVLAGGIAHDFNNLLMGILGNASLALLDLPPGHPIEVPIGHIERAGTRAADLCRQLLAYAGRGTLVTESVDLREIVTEIVTLLRASSWRHAKVHLDLPEALPRVEGDKTQLTQVVMNLLTNAVEALPADGGRVDISLCTRWLSESAPSRAAGDDQLRAGFYVCLDIRDEGSGMDDDTLGRIFEPFFSTKFTGRGLGLSAVSGIVRSHHGSIDVRSELNRGTSVCIRLPALEEVAALDREPVLNDRPTAARDVRPTSESFGSRESPVPRSPMSSASDPDATASDSDLDERPVEIKWTDYDLVPSPLFAQPPLPLRQGNRRQTALLVDDDPTVREVGRRMLTRLGFRVLQPREGQDLLQLWATERADGNASSAERPTTFTSRGDQLDPPPTPVATYVPIDVVILDMQASALSARAQLDRLRRAGIQVPVLFSTGDRGVCLPPDLGPNVHPEILHKPYRLEDLSRSLREALNPPEG